MCVETPHSISNPRHAPNMQYLHWVHSVLHMAHMVTDHWSHGHWSHGHYVHLHRVHSVLHMCDIRVLKGTAHVVDAIYC